MKNFRQYFVFLFFREEIFKVRKIFAKSLSDENFSMTKKRRFTVVRNGALKQTLLNVLLLSLEMRRN